MWHTIAQSDVTEVLSGSHNGRAPPSIPTVEVRPPAVRFRRLLRRHRWGAVVPIILGVMVEVVLQTIFDRSLEFLLAVAVENTRLSVAFLVGILVGGIAVGSLTFYLWPDKAEEAEVQDNEIDVSVKLIALDDSLLRLLAEMVAAEDREGAVRGLLYAVSPGFDRGIR